MLIDPELPDQCVTDLNDVSSRLRVLLAGNPPKRELDDRAVRYLDQFLDLATVAEQQLLPRRMLRALNQMSEVLRSWAARERRIGNEERAAEWLTLEALASQARACSSTPIWSQSDGWASWPLSSKPTAWKLPTLATYRCEISNRGS